MGAIEKDLHHDCDVHGAWATPAPMASAQIPVIDPANLAQSIMQVTHMIEQVRNQVQQIEQAAAMLRQNPLQLSPELSESISEARVVGLCAGHRL